MTAKELESKAWRLITLAKVAVNKTRRKVLIQEAFDLITRASALRQLDLNSEELNGHSSIGEQSYRMRLSSWDGATLWLYLYAESRADAMWAANALGGACSDCFEDFDLWDGSTQLPGREILSIFADSSEGVAAGTQQAVLDLEEMLLRTHEKLARSHTLLKAKALLRRQLTSQEQ